VRTRNYSPIADSRIESLCMRRPTWHRVATAGPHLHFIATLLWPVLRASQRCRRRQEEKNKKDPSHSLHVDEVARLSPILQARLLVRHGYLCGTDTLVRHFFAVDSCFVFLNTQNKKSAANRPRLTIPQRLQQLAKLPDSACRPSPTKPRDPLDGSASVTILS
jgi:hypothetical protein